MPRTLFANPRPIPHTPLALSVFAPAREREITTLGIVYFGQPASQLIRPHVNPKNRKTEKLKNRKHWKATNPYLHNPKGHKTL